MAHRHVRFDFIDLVSAAHVSHIIDDPPSIACADFSFSSSYYRCPLSLTIIDYIRLFFNELVAKAR